MNSVQEIQTTGTTNDELGQIPAPDTNANVSNDISKGAIPKKSKSTTQKNKTVSKVPQFKLNNNIENMSTLNSEDAPKINGLSNGIPPNYMEINGSGDLLEPSCSSIDLYGKYDLDKDDSSSDDNDLLSVSDDGCIYTYKGDQAADLPSSFFSLDIPPDVPDPLPNRNQTSSPEMDYLEMDFDPGVNGEADSNSENEIDNVRMDVKQEQVPEEPLQIQPVKIKETTEMKSVLSLPSTSFQPAVRPKLKLSNLERRISSYPETLPDEVIKEMPWSCSLSQRTRSIKLRVTKRCHTTRGELVSPNESVPQIKGATVWKQSVEDTPDQNNLEPMMIWSKEEAYLKQVTQIGPSACGATAVLNVLHALRFPIPSIKKIQECVKTRLRKNDGSLCDYLLSRSVAGTTHADLIEGLNVVSNGTVYARFFHMYPERVVNLYSWLTFWIKNGAVPIATLNLQRCLGTIPDAWHHQMIFGVDANGIHLTNPLECVEAGALWPQLCSESVLLVRREDVLSRWNFRTDLPELMKIMDIRWRRINVVGQVANMIHESSRELRPGFTNTSHIRIPAAYSSGITLATTVNSPAFSLLKCTPELPLLYS